MDVTLAVSQQTSNFEDVEWLSESLQLPDEHLSPSDGTLIYYISGCIGRSVARGRKCNKCKTLLIDENSDPDFEENCDLKQEYTEHFELLSRGGLARPSALNFSIVR